MVDRPALSMRDDDIEGYSEGCGGSFRRSSRTVQLAKDDMSKGDCNAILFNIQFQQRECRVQDEAVLETLAVS